LDKKSPEKIRGVIKMSCCSPINTDAQVPKIGSTLIPIFSVAFIILLCLFLLLPAFAQQQSQVQQTDRAVEQDVDSKEQIVRMLSSSNDKDRAWGAYLAGKHRFTELIPTLLKLFDTGFTDLIPEKGLVYRCALDSLIQMNAALPSKILLPVFDHFRPEAIILAANTPKDHEQEMLIMMQSNVNREEWMGLGNILSEQKTPGFAAMLLGDLHISVFVGVISDSNQGVGASGTGGATCGDGVISIPTGFPPVAFYQIKDTALNHSIVLSSGVYPIYYERHLMTEGNHGVGECHSTGDLDYARLQYLATMLGRSVDDLDIKSAPVVTIVWRSSDQYEKELTQIRSRIVESYKHLASRA